MASKLFLAALLLVSNVVSASISLTQEQIRADAAAHYPKFQDVLDVNDGFVKSKAKAQSLMKNKNKTPAMKFVEDGTDASYSPNYYYDDNNYFFYYYDYSYYSPNYYYDNNYMFYYYDNNNYMFYYYDNNYMFYYYDNNYMFYYYDNNYMFYYYNNNYYSPSYYYSIYYYDATYSFYYYDSYYNNFYSPSYYYDYEQYSPTYYYSFYYYDYGFYSYTIYAYQYYDYFQDDFGAQWIDDDKNEATTIGDDAFYNIPGWIYYQFFDGNCGATTENMIYNTGYLSGECIPLAANSAFMLTVAESGTCAGLRAQWFTSNDCKANTFIGAALLDDFTECHSWFGGMSYKGGCSSGQSMPIAV
jgi:hypothetical protein